VDEIRAAFPLEFQAAQLMVSYINSHTANATLPVDEAAFIALHLNAARQGVTVKQPLAVANELAGLLRFVCARLGATTTTFDGTVDHSLALELTRMSNRVGSKQFRSNLARRSIERDLPSEFDVAQQVLCRMIDVPTLPSHAAGEAAYLAVFLHGWRQSVRPST